ncbi:hypothetical protein C8R45DRAFT_942663 [Mycena sanguinolenta]|nr:hypothetical protein C8R45DRAFT_942663 [Mycena sanguinolenta]
MSRKRSKHSKRIAPDLTPEVYDHPDWLSGSYFEHFTGPIPDPQLWDPKYNLWNSKRIAFKRVSDEIFVLLGQGQDSGTYLNVVTAKQVALFLSHNERLWMEPPKDGKRIPEPLGFSVFSMHASAFDGPEFVWSFWDEKASRYVYTTTDGLNGITIPHWTSWLVHPHHIGEYRVPKGMALVDARRKRMIDAQLERNILSQFESRSWRDQRRHKSTSEGPAPNEASMLAAILARNHEASAAATPVVPQQQINIPVIAAAPAPLVPIAPIGPVTSQAVPPVVAPPPLPPVPTVITPQVPVMPVQPVASTSSQVLTVGTSSSTTLPPIGSLSINPATLFNPPDQDINIMTDDKFQDFLAAITLLDSFFVHSTV